MVEIRSNRAHRIARVRSRKVNAIRSREIFHFPCTLSRVFKNRDKRERVREWNTRGPRIASLPRPPGPPVHFFQSLFINLGRSFFPMIFFLFSSFLGCVRACAFTGDFFFSFFLVLTPWPAICWLRKGATKTRAR